MNKKPVTKQGYKYKLLQLIGECNPKNKNNLDISNIDEAYRKSKAIFIFH